MGIVQAVGAFPELKAGHDDWRNEFVEFIEDVEEGLPSGELEIENDSER